MNEPTLPHALAERLHAFAGGRGQLVVLTGAGISAESGIPTFRGKEGYWVVGSKEYHPQEMATFAMFKRRPEEVWAWYLYRRTICRGAEPNDGHRAVVELEQLLGDRFLLITQNVDGLHLRAGNSLARTYQIHGNVDYARCVEPATSAPWALPEDLPPKEKGAGLSDAERVLLRDGGGGACRGWARPHVLWFDECYDEETFRFESSLRAAASADILLVVGTSGATNLPMQVGTMALRQGAMIVDLNPEPNPFSELAAEAQQGFFLQGPSGAYLPLIVEALRGGRSRT
ncbi:MAG: RNA polymerase subunit sigma [Proteobacteria bacterium]|nr:MAG: RNA polymerase subunit sigma [Pseudomonadota bacterium]